MAEDDSIKKLEARLTRVEAALSQAGGGATAGRVGPIADPVPFGPIADPGPFPPYGGGWGGWGGWRPHPIVDPATYAYSTRLTNAVVDPGPYGPYGGGGWGGGRPHPIVDSATYANSVLARVGPVGDPPPPDVSRFSVAQLEATLHSINAEKARLSSLENMVSQQLEKARKQQG